MLVRVLFIVPSLPTAATAGGQSRNDTSGGCSVKNFLNLPIL